LARLGQAIVYVAVTLYVYELTGSAREISFAVALELLPYVFVGPIAGLLADRLERKAILIGAYLAQAVLIAALAFTTTVAQIYALVFLSSIMVPITNLVWAAALPSITGPQLFVRGTSLDIVALNTVNVAGPILAGWLVNLAGARPTLLVAMTCLIAAALLTLRASIPGPEGRQKANWGPRLLWEDLREALHFMLRRPALRYSLMLNSISLLGWSAPSIAAVIYLNETLQAGGQEYGLLRGTISLSMALGVFFLGRYTRRLPLEYLLMGGTVMAGLGYTLTILRPGMILLLAIWFFCGLGWSSFWLADNTLWARATTDQVRGRVYSLIEAIIALLEVLAALLGGWLINLWGPIPSLVVIGGAISGGSVLLALLTGGHRSVAQYNDRMSTTTQRRKQ
jgi:MFS family permease